LVKTGKTARETVSSPDNMRLKSRMSIFLLVIEKEEKLYDFIQNSVNQSKDKFGLFEVMGQMKMN